MAKKLYLFLILGMFLIGLVSAQVNQQNYIFEGEIDSSGNLITTTNAISDYDILSYVCNDNSCSTVGNKIFDLSGDNPTLLTYPTTLQGTGYGIYFYKPGYILWEAKANWAGTGDVADYSLYLTKKQLCSSSINTLILTNDSSNIYINTNIDSPINHAGPLDYIPSSLEDYYEVLVNANLEVKKDGIVIYTETKSKEIDYSGDEDFDFSIPSNSGVYEIKITSTTNDGKCIADSYVEKIGSITITAPDACLSNSLLGQSCSVGIGACNNNGVYVCNSAGTDVECNAIAGTPAPSDANCNNIDDNCNGQIDEEYVETPTSCGVGACLGNGLLQCISGSEIDSCSIGVPSTESCNGIDDDCDGDIDEDNLGNPLTRSYYTGPSITKNIGICSEGTEICSSGSWNINIFEVTPQTETCDGFLDENCDGTIDDGCSCTNGDTKSCGSDVGECSKGTQTCSANSWGSCVGDVGPTPEICGDGLDNDCDGDIDEDCDLISPIVNLLLPLNNQIFYGISYLIDFIFTVIDGSEITGCYVDVSGTQYPNTTAITKTGNNSIESIFSQGTYTAQVFCTDDSNNHGNSSQINFQILQCTTDSQCSSDYYSDKYCSSDDVYKDLHNFSCVSGSCEENITKELVEECEDDCEDGKCTEDKSWCEGDECDEVNKWMPGYEDQEENQTINSIMLGQQTSTDLTDSSDSGNYLWLILIIIAIIILLILISLIYSF